jgi:aspartyl aminopeptidase
LEGSSAGKDDKKEKHHSTLLKLLSDEIECKPSEICDLELSLCDTQPAVIGGLADEFIFSPRLDNLVSSFCSLEALIQYSSCSNSVENENRVSLIALFDNEEVGSSSERGAASTMVESFVNQVTFSFPGSKVIDFDLSMRKSFLISADMGHCCHPNYPEKHEPNHRPKIHGGPVVKENQNQRYATNSVSGSLLRVIAEKNQIPLQEFVVRNDSLCGSTIGPILSTKGIRTIDIGIPQLSMHSIREMCGVEDFDFYTRLMLAFFKEISPLDESLIID